MSGKRIDLANCHADEFAAVLTQVCMMAVVHQREGRRIEHFDDVLYGMHNVVPGSANPDEVVLLRRVYEMARTKRCGYEP